MHMCAHTHAHFCNVAVKYLSSFIGPLSSSFFPAFTFTRFCFQDNSQRMKQMRSTSERSRKYLLHLFSASLVLSILGKKMAFHRVCYSASGFVMHIILLTFFIALWTSFSSKLSPVAFFWCTVFVLLLGIRFQSNLCIVWRRVTITIRWCTKEQ